MDVVNDVSTGLVTKRAQTGAERGQLRREADLLRLVAHPGVIQLVAVEGGDPPSALIVRRVTGPDLSRLGPQSLQVIAGLGAAIATTLADLHDLGVYHGAIEAAHVLLDEEGRPVLCGFGRAERGLPPSRAQTLRREDTRALADLLLTHLNGPVPPGLGRTLRRTAGPGRQRRSGDARWLARQLSGRVPGARLPDGVRPGGPEQTQLPPSDELPPRSTTPRHRRAAALVGATGIGCVTIAVLVLHFTTARSAAGQPRPCPAADLGCAPLSTTGDVIATPGGRYLLGQTGDVVVVGRWRCGSTALPAVLRPRTGQLWTFATWPRPGQPVMGRLAASHLAGATGMQVLAQKTGCDRIEVDQRRGPPLIVAIRGR